MPITAPDEPVEGFILWRGENVIAISSEYTINEVLTGAADALGISTDRS
ncbi:hypothetical protein [Roseovarius nanhaiticus]|nr:hypothetical protein [Roseovarius nanhaiticus]